MIALDTNVFIYACDEADPRRQQIALELISNTAGRSHPLAGRV